MYICDRNKSVHHQNLYVVRANVRTYVRTKEYKRYFGPTVEHWVNWPWIYKWSKPSAIRTPMALCERKCSYLFLKWELFIFSSSTLTSVHCPDSVGLILKTVRNWAFTQSRLYSWKLQLVGLGADRFWADRDQPGLTVFWGWRNVAADQPWATGYGFSCRLWASEFDQPAHNSKSLEINFRMHAEIEEPVYDACLCEKPIWQCSMSCVLEGKLENHWSPEIKSCRASNNCFKMIFTPSKC